MYYYYVEDIFNIFYYLVLGKISEGQDYEELKNKKLSEQIKYLLEGPRFVVNINVPSQVILLPANHLDINFQ